MGIKLETSMELGHIGVKLRHIMGLMFKLMVELEVFAVWKI